MSGYPKYRTFFETQAQRGKIAADVASVAFGLVIVGAIVSGSILSSGAVARAAGGVARTGATTITARGGQVSGGNTDAAAMATLSVIGALAGGVGAIATLASLSLYLSVSSLLRHSLRRTCVKHSRYVEQTSLCRAHRYTACTHLFLVHRAG